MLTDPPAIFDVVKRGGLHAPTGCEFAEWGVLGKYDGISFGKLIPTTWASGVSGVTHADTGIQRGTVLTVDEVNVMIHGRASDRSPFLDQFSGQWIVIMLFWLIVLFATYIALAFVRCFARRAIRIRQRFRDKVSFKATIIGAPPAGHGVACKYGKISAQEEEVGGLQDVRVDANVE